MLQVLLLLRGTSTLFPQCFRTQQKTQHVFLQLLPKLIYEPACDTQWLMHAAGLCLCIHRLHAFW